LRALGTFLDTRPSCRITLAEVPEGFLVRLQHGLDELEPDIMTFSHNALEDQLDLLYQRHRPVLHARHRGVWASFPSGHSDFFRALGHELDQSGARDILIDELEDGLMVTYRRSNGTQVTKRSLQLDRPDIERILNQSFDRRASAVRQV
jgi:hypothetical protein